MPAASLPQRNSHVAVKLHSLVVKSIRLTTLTEDAAQPQLYIVAVNSFNGVVKQIDGSYLKMGRL